MAKKKDERRLSADSQKLYDNKAWFANDDYTKGFVDHLQKSGKIASADGNAINQYRTNTSPDQLKQDLFGYEDSLSQKSATNNQSASNVSPAPQSGSSAYYPYYLKVDSPDSNYHYKKNNGGTVADAFGQFGENVGDDVVNLANTKLSDLTPEQEQMIKVALYNSNFADGKSSPRMENFNADDYAKQRENNFQSTPTPAPAKPAQTATPRKTGLSPEQMEAKESILGTIAERNSTGGHTPVTGGTVLPSAQPQSNPNTRQNGSLTAEQIAARDAILKDVAQRNATGGHAAPALAPTPQTPKPTPTVATTTQTDDYLDDGEDDGSHSVIPTGDKFDRVHADNGYAESIDGKAIDPITLRWLYPADPFPKWKQDNINKQIDADIAEQDKRDAEDLLKSAEGSPLAESSTTGEQPTTATTATPAVPEDTGNPGNSTENQPGNPGNPGNNPGNSNPDWLSGVKGPSSLARATIKHYSEEEARMLQAELNAMRAADEAAQAEIDSATKKVEAAEKSAEDMKKAEDAAIEASRQDAENQRIEDEEDIKRKRAAGILTGFGELATGIANLASVGAGARNQTIPTYSKDWMAKVDAATKESRERVRSMQKDIRSRERQATIDHLKRTGEINQLKASASNMAAKARATAEDAKIKIATSRFKRTGDAAALVANLMQMGITSDRLKKESLQKYADRIARMASYGLKPDPDHPGYWTVDNTLLGAAQDRKSGGQKEGSAVAEAVNEALKPFMTN